MILIQILTAILFGCAIASAQDKGKQPNRSDVKGVEVDDAEMNEAMDKARKTLKRFAQAIQQPEDGKRYLLKVKIAEGDDVEHVWLEPVKWKDPGIIGVLASEPVAIKRYKVGDVVAPLPQEVSDWAILSEDGSMEGGFTKKLLEKRQKESEQTAPADRR